MWSSNVTKAISCLGRAVNHAWLSALCSSRTCLCSHLSLWAAPGYQRQQPFIATHTENQGNKESSEMSGYMAAWGRGPYEEGQMEGSGPQQCQAHWHTFRPLTAGASRAGGVESAVGTRGGAEIAAAPPGGLCWCQELPGHTWCQTGEQTHSRRSWGSPRLHRTPV